MKDEYRRDPVNRALMKDDIVAFKCTCPAIGRVYRVAAGQAWVDVKWFDGSSASSGRYSPKDLLLVNPIITNFVERIRK